MKTETWLAFLFGAFFLFISLVFALVAFYLPKPPNPQVVDNFLNVMQVVLAISASGLAAVIPGFLSVTVQQKIGKVGSVGIRAGGAIAVFVIVYVVNPKAATMSQMNQRVSYNEYLEKCRAFIPVAGAPLSGALEYCNEARDFDPKRWEAYRQLARIYYWNEEYPKSIQSYNQAISLMIRFDSSNIHDRNDVPLEFATEFSLMEYGIAMGYVGSANTLTRQDERRLYFNLSVEAATKSMWFALSRPDLFIDLKYILALDDAYIWLDDPVSSNSKKFDDAIAGFEESLLLPNAVTQWADYHLACLFNEAARLVLNNKVDFYRSQTRQFLIKAIKDLLRSKTEKAAIQFIQMKCRLRDPASCSSPRGSEPMICKRLPEIVSGDTEIQALVSSL